ncbi:MAG: CRP/FNR family cyclic AMP-dependent transcriptional regulator [Paraglaciecola sp.]|jgi:CRP/FNR family cyclic AMP-dependent transcriptional regulator
MQLEIIRPILRQSHWFQSLPESAIEQLLPLAKIKKLDSGQLLHRKNDQADGLYCVLSGKIRVSNVTREGKELVLTWLQPGSWFGEISLFDGLPRTHDAHSEQPSELLKIANQDFSRLLNQHPELYPHFMRLLCQRIRATFSLIDEAGSLSLKGQLCRRILLLVEGLERQTLTSTSISLSISQGSLALMLHSSRQTVNKLLQELQQDNLIRVYYGQLTILDLAGLNTMSQS